MPKVIEFVLATSKVKKPLDHFLWTWCSVGSRRRSADESASFLRHRRLQYHGQRQLGRADVEPADRCVSDRLESVECLQQTLVHSAKGQSAHGYNRVEEEEEEVI